MKHIDTKRLQYVNRHLRGAKPAYFLAVSGIFAVMAVYGLRQNNFKMIELREAVVVADQQNGDVETALQNLRQHVHSHMNTDLKSGNTSISQPIQLKGRYERLVQAEAGSVKAANEKVAREGEATCADRFPAGGYNAPRVACIQDYVSANAVQPGSVAEDLYKFNFVSPRWSPDLAGFSIILSGLFFVLFLIRFALTRLSR